MRAGQSIKIMDSTIGDFSKFLENSLEDKDRNLSSNALLKNIFNYSEGFVGGYSILEAKRGFVLDPLRKTLPKYDLTAKMVYPDSFHGLMKMIDKKIAFFEINSFSIDGGLWIFQKASGTDYISRYNNWKESNFGIYVPVPMGR